MQSDQTQSSSDDPILMMDDVSREEEQEEERLFFDYLTRTYKMFLSGDDNYDGLQSELAENFEKKTRHLQADIDSMAAEVAILEKDLAPLESEESPLILLERERSLLLTDVEKYKKFIKYQQGKMGKLSGIISDQKLSISGLKETVEKYMIEKHTLVEAISRQKISASEAGRIRNEISQSQKALHSLKGSTEEWTRSIASGASDIRAKIDSLEQSVRSYNGLAERLSLCPPTAKHAHGRSYALTIDESRPSLPLSLDLTNGVLPVVQALKDSLLQSYHEILGLISSKTNSISSIKENLSDKTEELSLLEDRIRKMDAESKSIKEQYSGENASHAQHLDHLERELMKMKGDMATNYLLSQEHLQKAILEYDQVVQRTLEEKENAAKEVFKMLEECISLKSHIEEVFSTFDKWMQAQEIDSCMAAPTHHIDTAWSMTKT